MKLRHNDFGSRHAFALVDVGRNAAAVVAYRARAVWVENDGDFLGEAGKRLVDGVIDDLVDHVMQARAVVGIANVHARPLAHGIKPLEHLDRFSVVIGRCGKLFADRFSHVWAFESPTKNMCESPKLVHQKGDPYRTKGALLTYCQLAIFQGFGVMQKQSCCGPRTAAARPPMRPGCKSRFAAVQRLQSRSKPAAIAAVSGPD